MAIFPLSFRWDDNICNLPKRQKLEARRWPGPDLGYHDGKLSNNEATIMTIMISNDI